MGRGNRFSIGVLLIIATSAVAVERPLEGGYFKWLLHLGQSPSDRIHKAYGHRWIDGDPYIKPAPGQIMDFSDEGGGRNNRPATHDMLIWTPQYSDTGYFADEGYDDWFTQYYHIYIHSPNERPARLRFRKLEILTVWNNGEEICHVRDFDWHQERQIDFTLHAGINSMTFKLTGPPQGSPDGSHLAVRITDRNDTEFSDLTYSLEPPLPDKDILIVRQLPEEYDPGHAIDVTLKVEIDPNVESDVLHVIEYIPEAATVAETGGGRIIHNALWWTLRADAVSSTELHYRLATASDSGGAIPFVGYYYRDKMFEEIVGGKVLFEDQPIFPADVLEGIETIEIYPADFIDSNNIVVGGTNVQDYSGSLENFAAGLVTGLKPHQTGGWAEYQLSVTHAGDYQVILDYGELWTMFHHTADVNIVIDGTTTIHSELYPTTHSYGGTYTSQTVYGPTTDPERNARWIVGVVSLSLGKHTLRLCFPPMYPEDKVLDRFTDGRPVITRVVLVNYPGLTVPGIGEPHHLDSYEHPPARLVHDRNVEVLPDGRVEMTYHGTFYNLSQGNELYFADGSIRPRPGRDDTLFEFVSIEPEVFHLPPGAEQDFSLVVRSKEVVPEDYSEMVVVWLQGVPSSPARRPYLFTTGRRFVDLPPYEARPFSWTHKPLLDLVWDARLDSSLGIHDDAVVFIPDQSDLGLDGGRYQYDVEGFFQHQLEQGKLPSVELIGQDGGWDKKAWRGRVWSTLLASTYWGGDPRQAKDFVQRLSENMVFYPVKHRWDWARPAYLPWFSWIDFVKGMPALAAHIRTVQEKMIDDSQQFKILHNMVLPIFNSYWDELRTVAIFTKDANEGDTVLYVDRPTYGKTGNPTDGFNMFIPAYVRIEGEPYSLHYTTSGDVVELTEPLKQAYPKGTKITSWAFIEEIELEGRGVSSLVAIAAASRDAAVVDESLHMLGEIFELQEIFLDDGSFKNEPGSYGSMHPYPGALLKAKRLLGEESLRVVSEVAMDKIHQGIINVAQFPFSNGKAPHLNGGGAMNQLNRSYFKEIYMLEELFPEDQEHIELYKRIEQQENDRVPGDIIDNHNFVVHGWGYAMLRSENGSWDRGMETLLSSKHLLGNGGDHVSPDCLGLVIYGLGTILTPRYGYSWISGGPPFLNQVMMDDDYGDKAYYGSFWHFDGRSELPSSVAHTGDGNDCTDLSSERSRWCIQFPEYLFDAYFIEAKDGAEHHYGWCFINMGELELIEPAGLSWQDYPEFLDGHWPEPGTRGAGSRTIASKGPGRIAADWIISNAPWVPDGDPTLLRESPQHSGRLRLIMADDGSSQLVDAQIGWYSHANGEQTLANSQDILAVRKNAVSHAFVDTLEPIADDEPAYVADVIVVAKGNHNQQLVKVVTSEGEDWVYLSSKWGSRPDGNQPLAGITTDADLLAWRVIGNEVTRFYLAGGSYAITPHGSWDFGSQGNYYTAGIDDGGR
jgi:hypothetical protein